MKTKTNIKEKPKAKLDLFLWIVVFILLALGIGADYYLRTLDWSLLLAGWIILGCVLVALIMQTTQGRKSWKFAKESRTEMRKVVWPKRKETIRTTAIVAALVLLTALILWGVDGILIWAIGWLTGQRG